MEDHNENYFQEEPEIKRQGGSDQLIDFGSEEREPEPVVKASAPAHDDNGYIVVPPTPQSSVDVSDHRLHEDVHEHERQQRQQADDINRVIEELSQSAERVHETLGTVIAEADSSTGVSVPQAAPPAATERSSAPTAVDTKQKSRKTNDSNCSLCPYYLLACDRLSKVEIPAHVRDLLLWKCPKKTGAVFGSVLVLLISLASFSLFTVLGSLLFLITAGVGSYRFYLNILFRIKGTYDDTFDKLSAQDFSLPKERVQRLIQLLETDGNRLLNQLKSLLLWDSLSNSLIALTGFYSVYYVGAWFNTLTLLILAHVSVFTLPKVYEVYKQPIDQAIEKVTTAVHQGANQLVAKFPFLHPKKKTQ